MSTTIFILRTLWIALLSFLIILAVKVINIPITLTEKTTLMLIAAIATTVTVIGSLLVAQITSASNSRRERNAEIRKIKQDYYHRFMDALAGYLAHKVYKNKGFPIDETKEFEAKHKFCNEKNRLPLYASQEIVEWVNTMMDKMLELDDFRKLYALIREDLCADLYASFNELSSVTFQIPDIPEPKKGEGESSG